jgi:hypothetical protein
MAPAILPLLEAQLELTFFKMHVQWSVIVPEFQDILPMVPSQL